MAQRQRIFNAVSSLCVCECIAHRCARHSESQEVKSALPEHMTFLQKLVIDEKMYTSEVGYEALLQLHGAAVCAAV